MPSLKIEAAAGASQKLPHASISSRRFAVKGGKDNKSDYIAKGKFSGSAGELMYKAKQGDALER